MTGVQTCALPISGRLELLELLALLPDLRGRRLGCWCAPLPCHAMVIAELADAGQPTAG